MQSLHDPFLGCQGYFDGSDLSVILGEGKKLLPQERRAYEMIYGDIFPAKTPPKDTFDATRAFLRQIGTVPTP